MLPHVVPLTRLILGTSAPATLFSLALLAPALSSSATPGQDPATPYAVSSDPTATIDSPDSSPATKTVTTPADVAESIQKDDRAYLGRFWLVDPRVQPKKAEADLMKFEVHGEYQLRYTKLTNIGLSDYAFPDYRRNLGQNQRLEHRMRFTPRFNYRRSLGVVAQFDVPHGMLLGDATDHVAGDPLPMTTAQPMSLTFRWLYAEFRSSRGQLSVGQQPARWGLGLVFDSGDERQFLGDARLGTIVERIAFLGRPLGRDSKFELLLATDLVYSDARARWLDGDRDLRAMIGLSYVDRPERRVGLLLIGEKFQPNYSNADLKSYRPSEKTATFNVTGQTSFPVPGQPAYIVAESELAAVIGTTDIAPEVLGSRNARVQRFGALARIGTVATKGMGHRRWGKWGVMLEWGYASGDADPSDGVDRRFVTNPARRVGLILFDEVMRWKSARAQAALADPRLGLRPVAAATTLPTAGGVSGATYLSLQWMYRPLPNFDLRAATLLAQTATDLVDPARLITSGTWSNFDGGRPAHRDLGVELDLAAELRQPLDNGLGIALGAEGGVLFPGRALADANDNSLSTQALVRGRFGFYF